MNLTSPPELSRRMYLSGATLVVVPGTLIPHWRQQILQHVKQAREGAHADAGGRAQAPKRWQAAARAPPLASRPRGVA